MLWKESLEFIVIVFFGTENDHDLVSQTGRARSINRHSWNDNELRDLILNEENPENKLFNELRRRIRIRENKKLFIRMQLN